MSIYRSNRAPSRLLLFAILATVLALVGVACSSDDGEESTTTAAPAESTTTAAPAESTTTAAPAESTTTAAPDWGAADFNGDGVVRIAVATEGPRDDGGYYQALVETVEQISTEAGYETPLVVDQITAADSGAELENIAAQGVDIIAIGSSGLAEGNEALFTEYGDIFWYCNCGSGYQDTPGLHRSADSGAELSISAGYATGLLLQERGESSAAFIGCCDLNFEVESLKGMEFGLKQVDESFTVTYVPTGAYPYDFNNTAAATEAYNNLVAEGAAAVYPFLGGAHEPIVQLANEDEVVVMTAGSSTGCERDDIGYDLEVRFDAGDYLETIFAEILSGEVEEGGVRMFTVGVDPQVGAEFCDATPEQVEALDEFNKRIGAGEFGDDIYAILSEAYGF
ncbi:MAG: BMP family ABC transporter substrate-binding protein [Actinomycetota bacterium]